MKLSDAIVLGSTITKPTPCDMDGCALGMAVNALVGVGVMSSPSERYNFCTKQWPWLLDRGSEGIAWGITVMYEFDHGSRLFEQFVEWVRLIEPECAECGCRNCNCVGVGELLTQSVSAVGIHPRKVNQAD